VNDLPRKGSGTSGIGGKFRSRQTEVISSGTPPVDALAIGGCRTDYLAHFVRALRHRDADRPLVNKNVEGTALQVSVGILGGQQLNSHGFSPSTAFAHGA
jgi:hypothetical protein